MKTISLKNRIILIISTIVLFTALFVGISLKVNADNNQPRNMPGPELKVGRYYVDGDTNQYYLEVTKEGTIQLKGVDYLEYANWKQLSTNEQTPEAKAAVQEYADELSKAYTYKTVYYPGMKLTAVLTSWEEDKNGCIGGTGYDYIDENTLKRGSGEIFIFASENEIAKDVVKSDKVTRIVDAVKE